ncbi:MAG: hypothetical protein ACUVSC_10565, partial [Candidatus Fervidibacter sp.]
MKRVGLLAALHKAGMKEAIKQLVNSLEGFGIEVVLSEEIAKLVGRDKGASLGELTKVDMIVALGGDGCVLSASRIAAPNNI